MLGDSTKCEDLAQSAGVEKQSVGGEKQSVQSVGGEKQSGGAQKQSEHRSKAFDFFILILSTLLLSHILSCLTTAQALTGCPGVVGTFMDLLR